MITTDAMALCRSCRHIRRTRCDLGMVMESSMTDATICGNFDSPKFLSGQQARLTGQKGEI